MKNIFLTAILSMVIAFGAVAQSAKVTARTADFTLLQPTSTQGQWTTLLDNTIKVAQNHDLFITACCEVGLYTGTLVRSKGMVNDTSTAKASVKARVVLDLGTIRERIVQPGEITFGRRSQQLSAQLEGGIAGALSVVTNATGGFSVVLDPELVVPEVLELIQDTLDAASFSWVAVDVPVGVHTVSVQAKIDTTGTVQNGTFEARALVGRGAFTCESVRLVKSPGVVMDVP